MSGAQVPDDQVASATGSDSNGDSEVTFPAPTTTDHQMNDGVESQLGDDDGLDV